MGELSRVCDRQRSIVRSYSGYLASGAVKSSYGCLLGGTFQEFKASRALRIRQMS